MVYIKLKNWQKVLLLFFVTIALHFLFADYIKSVKVFPDETLYYSIADSLWHGNGVMVNNMPSNFQKILYSIVICPLFAISDIALRIKMITLLNCILMGSGLFPVYFLAKRYLKEDRHILFVCILYSVFSDLSYCTGFMAENLFLSMALFAVYLVSKLIERKTNVFYDILFGSYLFLVFLCKEIGVFIPIAYCIVLSFFIIKQKMKENTWNKDYLLHLIVTSVTFSILYIIMKVFIFTGADAYGSISAVGKNYLVVCYGTLFLLLMVSLSFGILPLLVPVIKNKNRFMVDFLLLLVIITAFTVGYTITVNEDGGIINPNVHLRYFCYLFLPFVILMLNTFENETFDKRDYHYLRLVSFCIVGMIVGLAIAAKIKGANIITSSAALVSETGLQFLAESGKYQIFLLLAICAVYSVLIFTIQSKKGKTVFLSLILIVNIVNTLIDMGMWRSNLGNQVTELKYDEELQLSKFVQEHKDKNILVLIKAKDYSLYTTYVKNDNTYCIDYEYLQDYIEDNKDSTWLNAESSLKFYYQDLYYKDLKNIDMIIAADNTGINLPYELDVPVPKKIDSHLYVSNQDELTGYHAYWIKDTEHIPVMTFENK